MRRLIKGNKIFDGEKFLEDKNTIVVEDGKISEVLFISREDEDKYEYLETYEGILVPGFINTHCHLELSYLFQSFIAHQGMIGFLKQMMEKRDQVAHSIIIEQAKCWDKRMQENGIVAVGDIVNSADTLEVKKQSSVDYINFVEVFGLNSLKAKAFFEKSVHLWNSFLQQFPYSSIVPHAPYSLSEKLWNEVLNVLSRNKQSIQSIHFLESMAEKNFLMNKPSDMRVYFQKEWHYSDEDLRHIPEKFSTYLSELLRNSEKIILVHNTYWNGEYIDILRTYKQKIYFCLCPHANLLIENRLPDVEYIKHFSDHICLGTDSLASNFDLNIVNEMNVLLKYFPNISIEEVLKWATSNGANALGLDEKYGYIKKHYSIPLNVIQIDRLEHSIREARSSRILKHLRVIR